jgi:hypothetical protein
MAKAKTPSTRTRKAAAPAAPEPAATSNVTSISTRSVDIQEVIRARAYELYVQRGRVHGHDFDDWLRAETEVLARFRGRTA